MTTRPPGRDHDSSARDREALLGRPGDAADVPAAPWLQHLPAELLPMALARAHRALPVGARLDLSLLRRSLPDRAGEDGTGADQRSGGERADGCARADGNGDDGDGGPSLAHWGNGALADLLIGGGFTVDEPPEPGHVGGAVAAMLARAHRARTLPDTVGPGMRLLVCGLNPSIYAADAGVGFARPGNRFWPAATAAGVVSVDRDADHALHHHGVGMTDLVKRATVAAGELTPGEYRAGLGRVERLVGWVRPRAICVVGLAGWRAAVDRTAAPGVQRRLIAGVPVYLMPSTSGLNARTPPAEHAAHLRRAARLAGEPA